VITGFGRTGNWFGSQTFGIKPHIMTIAKGLSSGYQPIGGSIVCDEVAEVVGGAGEFNHGYTYSGPSGGGGGRAGEPADHAGRKDRRACPRRGPPLPERRWAALADHPMVGEAKLVGLMGSIALTPDKAKRAQVRLGGRQRRLQDARAVLCQQSDHAPCRRPDDHRAAFGDHAGRDRHYDRAGPPCPPRSARRDVAGYMRFNYRFHFGLYRAVPDSVLCPLIESLWLQFGPICT
jgi:hypothetical protein